MIQTRDQKKNNFLKKSNRCSYKKLSLKSIRLRNRFSFSKNHKVWNEHLQHQISKNIIMSLESSKTPTQKYALSNIIWYSLGRSAKVGSPQTYFPKNQISENLFATKIPINFSFRRMWIFWELSLKWTSIYLSEPFFSH